MFEEGSFLSGSGRAGPHSGTVVLRYDARVNWVLIIASIELYYLDQTFIGTCKSKREV
jgi:hypothetical protein